MNKYSRYIILRLLFAFYIPLSFSQQNTIDSLKRILITTKIDSIKVDVLYELSDKLWRTGKFDSSLLYSKEALRILKTVSVYPQNKDENGSRSNQMLSSVYSNIGVAFMYLGNYPEALKNHFHSLKIREKIGFKRGIAVCNINLGNVYDSQGNYKDALKNYQVALQICKETNYDEAASSCYNNIGNVYNNMHNYPKALENYMHSMEIDNKNGDKTGIAYNYNNIGLVYMNQENYSKALENYFASLKLKEKLDDPAGIASTSINLSITYYKLKNYNEAEKYGTKGLKVSSEIEDLEGKMGANEVLSNVYNAQGKYKDAFKAYKAYISARDSLTNEENTKRTVQTQMQYEFDKKESAALLEQEKKDAVSLAESKKQKIIIYSISFGLVLIMILAMVILRSLRINQKKNAIITEQKEMVEKQKEIVEEKQIEILDSIRYAKRIQTALLPTDKYIDRNLKGI